MRVRRVPPIGVKIKVCDQCGGNYELGELRTLHGRLVCDRCYDKPTYCKAKPKGSV